MARPKFVWTKEMIELLSNFYPSTPTSELVEIMGVGRSTIKRKAKEMGLKKTSEGKIRLSTINAVNEMFGKYSYSEIAEKTGLSVRSVIRACKRMNLTLDKDVRGIFHSEAALKRIRSEERRVLFGLKPQTLRRIGRSKIRDEVIRELTRYGYLVIPGSMACYYSIEMDRNDRLEFYAESYGFKVISWE